MPQEEDNEPMSLDEAESHVSTKELPYGFWKLCLSSFIAIYFTSVCIWIFDEIPFRAKVAELCKDINILDGGTQHWSLFSPAVRHVIFHETATITFKDGSIKYYEFPRMTQLDQTEKFVHEKLRKIFSDCIPWTNYEQFQPDIAQFLASANRDKKNPPALVSMIFHYTNNPPPDPAHWSYRDRPPRHTDNSLTFVYAVRDKDVSLVKANSEQSNLRIVDTK